MANDGGADAELSEIGDRHNVCVLIEGGRYPNFHTTVALVRDPDNGECTLYDAGFPYDGELLVKKLAEIGIGRDEVRRIVLSHWHIDHCGAIGLFENADLLVSAESVFSIHRALEGVYKSEVTSMKPLDFLTEFIRSEMLLDCETVKENPARARAMANMVYRHSACWKSVFERLERNKARLVCDPETAVGGRMSIHKISTHTKGDLVLRVAGDSGRACVICGDLIPYREIANVPMLSENSEGFEAAIASLIKPGDFVIPGHGRPYVFGAPA